MCGHYSVATTINGVTVLKWLSRPAFKLQIKSPFKLQTSDAAYSFIPASNNGGINAEDNYSSIMTNGQDRPGRSTTQRRFLGAQTRFVLSLN